MWLVQWSPSLRMASVLAWKSFCWCSASVEPQQAKVQCFLALVAEHPWIHQCSTQDLQNLTKCSSKLWQPLICKHDISAACLSHHLRHCMSPRTHVAFLLVLAVLKQSISHWTFSLGLCGSATWPASKPHVQNHWQVLQISPARVCIGTPHRLPVVPSLSKMVAANEDPLDFLVQLKANLLGNWVETWWTLFLWRGWLSQNESDVTFQLLSCLIFFWIFGWHQREPSCFPHDSALTQLQLMTEWELMTTPPDRMRIDTNSCWKFMLDSDSLTTSQAKSDQFELSEMTICSGTKLLQFVCHSNWPVRTNWHWKLQVHGGIVKQQCIESHHNVSPHDHFESWWCCFETLEWLPLLTNKKPSKCSQLVHATFCNENLMIPLAIPCWHCGATKHRVASQHDQFSRHWDCFEPRICFDTDVPC